MTINLFYKFESKTDKISGHLDSIHTQFRAIIAFKSNLGAVDKIIKLTLRSIHIF